MARLCSCVSSAVYLGSAAVSGAGRDEGCHAPCRLFIAPTDTPTTFSPLHRHTRGADVGFPAAAGEPPKSLRGFHKVSLAAGGQTAVTFTLTSKHVSIWDVATGGWATVPGVHTAFLASSAADVRATAAFAVVA